jgi:tetratricopeptide (TPR) repeat protein
MSEKYVDDTTGQSTQIDLGEDLLTSTITAPTSIQPTDALLSGTIDEQLQNARILVNEGLLEEAKRVLRNIILSDPHCIPARKRLEEIHELELKQIFGESVEPKGVMNAKIERARFFEEIDSEKVLRALDDDLDLKMFGDPKDEIQRLVFGSSAEMDQFSVRLERKMSGTTARDRLDLGIGFLEMSFYELAIRQFRVAAREPGLEVAAAALIAQAQLFSDQAFEAVLGLESALRNSELEPEHRIHFLYLSALAHEKLSKMDVARSRFAQVLEIDPYYRDSAERLQRLR